MHFLSWRLVGTRPGAPSMLIARMRSYRPSELEESLQCVHLLAAGLDEPVEFVAFRGYVLDVRVAHIAAIDGHLALKVEDRLVRRAAILQLVLQVELDLAPARVGILLACHDDRLDLTGETVPHTMIFPH